tara:strand:+ start:21157 stop:21474 length:318 start_codon:yes stop_codon:yes gene_type:complete
MTWIVKMNTKAKHIAFLLALGGLQFSTTGCATSRLPWLAKNEETSSMESYIAQAASNIQYDTDVDIKQDYKSSAQPASSYTAPPTRTASLSSGGSDGSCSSGCCD